MANQNSLLKFSIIVLKIAATLMSILLIPDILLMIFSGGGSVVFPSLGLVISIFGLVLLLAIITIALWSLVFLLSNFISKPLH